MRTLDPDQPLAIAMWDFSWLERRWPGAGYENWDTALDELVERGYDAVRIDPFPHLAAADPHGRWELLPVWNQQMWRTRMAVQSATSPTTAALCVTLVCRSCLRRPGRHERHASESWPGRRLPSFDIDCRR